MNGSDDAARALQDAYSILRADRTVYRVHVALCTFLAAGVVVNLLLPPLTPGDRLLLDAANYAAAALAAVSLRWTLPRTLAERARVRAGLRLVDSIERALLEAEHELAREPPDAGDP